MAAFDYLPGSESFLDPDRLDAGRPEAAKAVEKIQSADNAKDTFERTMAHLKDNKLDLDAVQLAIGPNLEFDPKTERFRAGADVNARQEGGYTPLMGAEASGDEELVRLLMDHGAEEAAS